MNYRNHALKDVPTHALAFEILQREGTTEAPKKTVRFCKFKEAIIGIGNDHIASIELADDDYDELVNMMGDQG